MNHLDLISKNQAEFSKLRKWAMERNYYNPAKPDVDFAGVAFAGIMGTTLAANAASAITMPVQTGMAVGGALAAKSLRLGDFVAIIAHKTNIHKLVIQAAYNLSDKAQIIFNRRIQGLQKVPMDITRSAEFEFALNKIKFQSNTMFGIAQDKKNQFNPSTNIYMPSAQIDTNSPMYAKNRQIFNEIIKMIDNGIISPEEVKAIDAYTKGVSKFSLPLKPGVIGDQRFDRMVNYAVVVPKLEKMLDTIRSVQGDRECLKIDDAKSIESAQQREDRRRIVRPTVEAGRTISAELDGSKVKDMNNALSDDIASVYSDIAAIASAQLNSEQEKQTIADAVDGVNAVLKSDSSPALK